jgi:hypothetical protein
VVGHFEKYVGFEIDITGEKQAQIPSIPTDLLNLPDRKSDDILKLVRPMMILIYLPICNQAKFFI